MISLLRKGCYSRIQTSQSTVRECDAIELSVSVKSYNKLRIIKTNNAFLSIVKNESDDGGPARMRDDEGEG
jgi:hypothetical protein